jgi:DDE family transposase
MLALPPAAEPLIGALGGAFTRPSFARFVVLCVGCIVTFGRRSVSRILWTVRTMAAGDPSSYHRLLSRAAWSLWPLGKVLAAAVLELVPIDQPVRCAVDDTVTQHRGARIYGKGCHRDAVRSARGTHTTRKWGHKWVVLAILLRLPFAARPWALPVLCALYRVPQSDREEGRRRHKTPCDLARGMLATLLRWFPDRRFIVLGDGGFASHELARFCHRHRTRLTLIARGRDDLNLHALPRAPQAPPTRQTLWRRRCRGVRPRCRKGRKLPSPRQNVERARRAKPLPRRVALQWYGQSRRTMELCSAAGGWYRARGNGQAALVPLRWVYTRDPQTDREDWFICTDVGMAPAAVVEHVAQRWSIEVTFEEARAHLGLETPRQRCKRSVLRTTPCLLGLFSVVSLIFTRLWHEEPARDQWRTLHQTPCYRKAEPTFADALYAVRRLMWDGCLLKHVLGPRRVTTLPPRLKRTLLTYLAEAA